MIPTIIIVSLAFLWLGYETRWLTVRLEAYTPCEYGANCEWRLGDGQVDKTMKWELLHRWQLRGTEGIRFDADIIQPLFGWGYAYQFRNFQPEYAIELIGAGYKTTIHSNNASALRDAFRVWRNPYVKVKLSAP